MKKKLHQSDIKKMIKNKLPAFAAEKCSVAQIRFFCPYCVKYHHHGIVDDFYELSSKSAHCFGGPNAQLTSYYVYRVPGPLDT